MDPTQKNRDKKADRIVGCYWEDQFVQMARTMGIEAIKHSGLSIDRSDEMTHNTAHVRTWLNCEGTPTEYLLPDVELPALKQFHEIRHKQPMFTRHPVIEGGYFSWEKAYFETATRCWLNTKAAVYLTVHDHTMCGRDGRQNFPEQWVSADVSDLMGTWQATGTNYSHRGAGAGAEEMPCYIWPASLWHPTTELLMQ